VSLAEKWPAAEFRKPEERGLSKKNSEKKSPIYYNSPVPMKELLTNKTRIKENGGNI
jgi:hypothetical protein